MSVSTQVTEALHELEEELASREPMKGGIDSVLLAEKIRAVRRLVSTQGAKWVGTAKAMRLLGARSEHTVEAWARSGRLRSRTLPNGRLQVLLDDVLHDREVAEGLTAIDRGADMTQEELEQFMGESPPLYPGGPGYGRDGRGAAQIHDPDVPSREAAQMR